MVQGQFIKKKEVANKILIFKWGKSTSRKKVNYDASHSSFGVHWKGEISDGGFLTQLGHHRYLLSPNRDRRLHG